MNKSLHAVLIMICMAVWNVVCLSCHCHHCWNTPPTTSLCSHPLLGLHKWMDIYQWGFGDSTQMQTLPLVSVRSGGDHSGLCSTQAWLRGLSPSWPHDKMRLTRTFRGEEKERPQWERTLWCKSTGAWSCAPQGSLLWRGTTVVTGDAALMSET